MHMATKRSQLLVTATVVILVSFAIIIRSALTVQQYTTIDDYGPVISTEQYLELEKPTDGSWKTLVFYYHQRFFKVAYAYTYAPGQYLLHSFFLDRKQSYHFKKIANRLPSVFFSILTIGFLGYIATKLLNFNWYQLAFLLSIQCLSTQAIYYSAHGSNYSAAQLASIIITFFTLNPEPKSIKQKLLEALGFSFAVMLSYQSIILIFAAFCVRLCKAENLWQTIKNQAFCSAVIIATAIPTYLIPLTSYIENNNALNWNVGESHQFAVPLTATIFERLAAFIKLLSTIPTTADSLITPLQTPTKWFGIMATSLVLLGLYNLTKHNCPTRKTLYLFIIATLSMLGISVLLGRLSFGPTRHSLFLLPILALVITFGLDTFFTKKLSAPITITYCFTAIMLSAGGHFKASNLRGDHTNTIAGRIDEFISDHRESCETYSILPRQFKKIIPETSHHNLDFNISEKDLFLTLANDSKCKILITQRQVTDLSNAMFDSFVGTSSFGFKSLAPNAPNTLYFYLYEPVQKQTSN